MFSRRTEWKLAQNRLTEAQQELRAAGTPVLDLTVSNPTRVGLHYDDEAILSSLASEGALDYDPQPKGLLSARQAVAGYYRAQHEEFAFDPESLVLTTSTSEGYSYLFRLLCNPGDEVLVPKPSYPLFDFLADMEDVKLAPYPLIYDHGWQIDFPSLYKTVNHHTRAVVVVHPNNPTGSYASDDERHALNRFCREYGLALIIDEVFLDYAHDGAPRSSFVANDQALTFTLSGLSKISGLPQMKLAWIAGCGPQAEVKTALERLEVIADTFLSLNAPVQLAAPVLLEQRRQVQPLLLDRLRTNLASLDRHLVRHKSCARLQMDGGWSVVLRLPAIKSDEELAIDVLRKVGVLVHPGHFYDFAGDGYVVLSLITPPQDFDQGTKRILDCIES
jgi:alanine-synthesizing transaminase